MTVDALCFLGEARFHESISYNDLAPQMDELEIDMVVATAAKPISDTLARASLELAEDVADRADRVRTLLRIDPFEPDGLEALTAGPTWAGVFIHPHEENCPVIDPRWGETYSEAASRQLPVVVASGYQNLSEGAQVAAVARRHPDTMFVLTNGGQLNMSGLAQADANMALELPNTRILTAGVYREDFLLGTLSRFGPHKVLYASQMPTFDLEYELARVRLAHLDEALRQTVLDTNARDLFSRRGA